MLRKGILNVELWRAKIRVPIIREDSMRHRLPFSKLFRMSKSGPNSPKRMLNLQVAEWSRDARFARLVFSHRDETPARSGILVMPMRAVSKLSLGLLASAALALPASAQSYRHAPPRPAGGAPLIQQTSFSPMESLRAQLPFGGDAGQEAQANPPEQLHQPTSRGPARQLRGGRTASTGPGAPLVSAPTRTSSRALPPRVAATQPPVAPVNQRMPQAMAGSSSLVPPHLTQSTWTISPESIPTSPHTNMIPSQTPGPMPMAQPPMMISGAEYYANAGQAGGNAPRAMTPNAPAARPTTAPAPIMTQSAAELFAANAPGEGMGLGQTLPTSPSSGAMPMEAVEAGNQPANAPAAFPEIAELDAVELNAVPTPEFIPAGGIVPAGGTVSPESGIQMTEYIPPPVPPARPGVPSASPRPVQQPAMPMAGASVNPREGMRPAARENFGQPEEPMTRMERRRRGLPPLSRHVTADEPRYGMIEQASGMRHPSGGGTPVVSAGFAPENGTPTGSGGSSQGMPANRSQGRPTAPAVNQLPTLLTNAQRAMASEQFDQAMHFLDEARQIAPQDARPEALRARLHEVQGQWAEAVGTFDRLIILEPNMATWRLARARAFFQLGEYAKAIGDFRAVEATSSRLSLNDYTLLCESAFRHGDAKTVEYALGRIEQINPEPHPRSELIRGLIAFRTGDPVEARNILLRASAHWPRNEAIEEALRRTSAVYYRQKEENTAVAVSKKFTTPMSTSEAASLDLVREYTPPVPKTPATIWAKPDVRDRSTSGLASGFPGLAAYDPANEPARLGRVFAERIPETVPALAAPFAPVAESAPSTVVTEDGWSDAALQVVEAVQPLEEEGEVVSAGLVSQPRRSIGFR